MMSHDNKKSDLRKTLLERRDGLSYDIMVASEKQMRKHIYKVDEYSDAQTVGFYYSTGSEVPTQQMMLEARSQGRIVCLPRMKNGLIEFAETSGPVDLVEGEFGIMEPSPMSELVPSPDVIMVPAVGISTNGARLGRGGGHYDRYLAKYKGTSIGLAFSVQVVKNIPEQDWDMRVNWIITEEMTLKS